MNDAAAFFGRFHPLLVHFPIAFLILAGLLELLPAGPRARLPWVAAARLPLLGLGALTAVTAASAGYLLGTSGGYGGPTFERHLQLGLVVAMAATLTALAAWRRERTAGGPTLVRAGVVVTLGALTAAGHLGATLTHGDGYLTEFAPAPIRDAVARLTGPATAPRYAGSPGRAPIYGAVVRPILAQHCVACHAGSAAKGALALDTPDAIRKGGDHGPVVIAGQAVGSELVRRVWLPPEHADAMPPRGQRPLPAADAALLRWWVDSGASFDGTVADAEIAPDVLPVLEARLGPLSRGGPTIPAVTLAPIDAKALAPIRARGVDVSPVADGSPFLQVRLTGRGDGDDARVAALAPIAPHVLWLTLAGSGISDAAYATLARMPNLTRLDVSRTATTDAGVRTLGAAPQIEALNLYGTRVTDAALGALGAMPRLRRVYLWQTAATPAGVERLRTTAPRLEIVLGEESDPEPATAAPAATAAR